MRVLFLLSSLLLSQGCATSYKETMMADGKTWSVRGRSINGCNGFASDKSCIESVQKEITERGHELCGTAPSRVFACTRRNNAVECKVACP